MVKEITRIRPEATPPSRYMQRLWEYRQLIRTLVIRDFKGAFAQTILGWLWLLAKPLLVLAMFTVFFDQLLDLDTGAVPYPAFAFAGMSLWYFFSNLTNAIGGALQQSTELMQKIYFPKLVLLVSKSAMAVLELLVHLIILMVLIAFYGYTPTLHWLLIIPVIVLVYLAGFSVGLWVNNLSIRHRDMQHLVPQLVNVAIWLTPVFYPLTIVPADYHNWLYILNPMATCIETFRYALYGSGEIPDAMLINLSVILLFMGSGIFTFIRKEKNLIDRL